MLTTRAPLAFAFLLALSLSSCGKMSESVQNHRTPGSSSTKDLTGQQVPKAHEVADATPAPSQEDLPVSRLTWDGTSFQGNDTLQVMSVE